MYVFDLRLMLCPYYKVDKLYFPFVSLYVYIHIPLS